MTPPIQLGISVGITDLQVLDNEGNGGEGGILKIRLITKGLHANSLKVGPNLIVGIFAVTVWNSSGAYKRIHGPEMVYTAPAGLVGLAIARV